jgi:hypothetical protein
VKQNHRLWHAQCSKPYKALIITAAQPLEHCRIYAKSEFEHCLKFALPGINVEPIDASGHSDDYAYRAVSDKPIHEDIVLYNTIDEPLVLKVWGCVDA